MLTYTKKLFLIAFMLIYIHTFSINSNITHYTYKHLFGLTWQITAHLYNNCDYYGTYSPQGVYALHDTCNYQSKANHYSVRVDTLPNGLPYKSNCYTDNCSGMLTMCDSPYNATGFVAWRHVIYLDTITLQEHCGLWKFSLGAISAFNFRDPMVTNVAPSTYTYYYEAILNADSTKPNNSAVWERPMFMYAIEEEPTQWYLPITDPDGDSLVYTVVPPRERDKLSPNPLDTLIADIPYVNPFSINTQPFETYETWKFNPLIPSVSFRAAPNQLALLTFKVEEYRQGVFMGATFRDVLIKTMSSTHPIPRRSIDMASSQNVTVSSGDTIEVYAGQNVMLYTDYYSTASTAELYHESNINTVLPMATYTANYNGGDSIKTYLQWTPTLVDTGVYLLVTTLKDTSCTQTIPKTPQDYFHRLIIHPFPQIVSETQKKTSYLLYPNPAQNTITMVIPNGEPFKVYNTMGVLLESNVSATNGNTLLNVSNYANGIYFVRVHGTYSSFTVVK